MTAQLLLPILANLVIANPVAQQGEPAEAVFTKVSYDSIVDADPVEARAASFRPVPKIESAFPWVDRVQLLKPIILEDEVKPTADAPDLSWNIIDSDPVASRGF